MDNDQALTQRATKAAIRLLKSNLRRHIYTARREQGEIRWVAMLLVEDSFSKPALREWVDVVKDWDLSLDRGDLCTLISAAFSPAAAEVLSIFDGEQVCRVRRLIEEYHRGFRPSALLEPAC